MLNKVTKDIQHLGMTDELLQVYADLKRIGTDQECFESLLVFIPKFIIEDFKPAKKLEIATSLSLQRAQEILSCITIDK